jgi:hypothetical protein
MSDAPAKFYIDCEFNGHGGALISMAVISETGGGLYLCVPEPPPDLDPWVAENVWPLVHERLPIGRTVAFLNDWGSLIRAFMKPVGHPVIIADSPVDIGRFCTVLSTGPDGGWASADYPGMTFEVRNVDCYPTDLPGAVQHNAYWDAMALRAILARTAPRADADLPTQPAAQSDDLLCVVCLKPISDDDESYMGDDHGADWHHSCAPDGFPNEDFTHPADDADGEAV